LLRPESDNGIYRARDLVWYKTDYLRDNKLCYNFSRYNFFDTDAAYRLAYNQDITDIEQAFARLTLGEEVDFLEKRINDCLQLFIREERRYDRAIQELQDRLNEMNVEQSRLKSNSSIETVSINLIKESLTNLRWKQLISSDNESELEETYKLLLNCMNSISEANLKEIALDFFSISTLKALLIRNEEILSKINTTMQLVSKCQEELNNFGQELNLKKEEIKWLTVLQRYLQDNHISVFLGLSQHISSLEEKLLNYKESIAIIENFNRSLIENSDIPLTKCYDENSHEAERIRTVIQNKNIEINTALQKLSHKKAVKIRITGAVEELLQVQPDLSVCPVCGTVHEPGAIQKN
jgi:DNA repair protein SbcC/Rad50